MSFEMTNMSALKFKVVRFFDVNNQHNFSFDCYVSGNCRYHLHPCGLFYLGN